MSALKVGDKVTAAGKLYDGLGIVWETTGSLEIVALDSVDACVREADGSIYTVARHRLTPALVPTTETITITVETADLDEVVDFLLGDEKKGYSHATLARLANAIREARS